MSVLSVTTTTIPLSWYQNLHETAKATITEDHKKKKRVKTIDSIFS